MEMDYAVVTVSNTSETDTSTVKPHLGQDFALLTYIGLNSDCRFLKAESVVFLIRKND